MFFSVIKRKFSLLWNECNNLLKLFIRYLKGEFKEKTVLKAEQLF